MVGIPHVDRKVACSNLGHGMSFKGHRTMTFVWAKRGRPGFTHGSRLYGRGDAPVDVPDKWVPNCRSSDPVLLKLGCEDLRPPRPHRIVLSLRLALNECIHNRLRLVVDADQHDKSLDCHHGMLTE
ncbi:hypothetical protein E3N88_27431 [Mikania micrantha]|uniref:Uncharacterized protein n=1 Tax=Mikania micrantha TaxID=192012 RepID=A0A5N6MXR6_9ASTR|nr:hypothetical protein E3N88_27431 [Mikania micrantha]